MATTSFPDFHSASVLVVGDIMLDSYWHGSAKRLSPEAPVPVINVSEFERRLGGAANVALNMKSLGAEVTLLGLVGDDHEAGELHELLKKQEINAFLQTTAEMPTITKLRIISQQQQLLRLDFEESYHSLVKDTLFSHYQSQLTKNALVVLSDYAKGTLSNTPELINCAISCGRPVIVDPKGQDYSKYRNATLLTPNLKEFEAVVGSVSSEEQLVTLGMNLLKELALDALLITRGEEGMTLLQQSEAPFHLKTEAKEVFDVTGAGDTVIGVLSAALAANTPIKQAISLANKAAGIVVSRLGASSVTADCLKQVGGCLDAISLDALREKIRLHHADDKAYQLVQFESGSISLAVMEKVMAASKRGISCYLLFPKSLRSDGVQTLLESFSFISGYAFLSDEEIGSLSTLSATRLTMSM